MKLLDFYNKVSDSVLLKTKADYFIHSAVTTAVTLLLAIATHYILDTYHLSVFTSIFLVASVIILSVIGYVFLAVFLSIVAFLPLIGIKGIKDYSIRNKALIFLRTLFLILKFPVFIYKLIFNRNWYSSK